MKKPENMTLKTIELYFSDNGDFSSRPLNKLEKSMLDYLKTEKLYDKIYLYFGSKIYRKNTPLNYQVNDIYKLLQEGRYYHLYEKYGSHIYRQLLPYIKRQDIINELGQTSYGNNIMRNIKAGIATIIFMVLLANAIPETMLFLSYRANIAKKETILKNDDELQDTLSGYDDYIERYATYINSLNLNSLETIVKVIDDMWNSIEGYSNDVEGFSNELAYSRLALFHLGFGSCRHMADDFTAKINAINPEYKAYNMIVFLEEEQLNDYPLNNTVRNILETQETQETQESQDNEKNPVKEFIQNFFKRKNGNHMVSCITIPSTSTKLIVDPTNPSIGILSNGQIVILTEKDFKEIKICGATTMGINYEELLSYIKDFYSSFFTIYDYERLLESYGTVAQNKVLDYLQESYNSDEYEIEVHESYIDEHQHQAKTLTLKPNEKNR